MALCYHGFFTGNVQGVGFRYTVCDMSRRQGLVGWIKNLPDGRVELWVEGEEELLKGFFADIEDAFYVTDRQVDQTAASGMFSDFTIKY